MNLEHYRGKVIVISGGSSGIGYACAQKLVTVAKAVVLIALTGDKLRQAQAELRRTAPACAVDYFAVDVADSAAVQEAAQAIVEKYGAPDIVINNAGYAHYQFFHEMNLEEVERHASVNLIGAMRLTHCLLPAMRAAKRGQIVNVASIAGHMLITPNLVYAAAKHGMVAWGEGLALELAPDNITVHTVSPGRVLTGFFDHETFKQRAAGAETTLVTPLDSVVNAMLHGIAKRRPVTIVPAYWGVVAWALQAGNWLLKPVYRTILRRRLGRLRQTN